MNIVLVHNPKSGSALPVRDLHALFERHAVSLDKLIDITANFPASLKPYITEGTVIAALGGDGTLGSVAAELKDSKAIFAPLPGGTLNHFTKDLGISQDLEVAVAALAQGKVTVCDIASVSDKIFVNNSSIGVYPSSLHTRKQFEDKLGKWPAAVIGVIRAFVRYRSYEVTIDGETLHTPFVFVGNNDYHLDTVGGVRDRMDAGMLSVYIIQSKNRFDLFSLLGYALIGRLAQHEKFQTMLTKNITIHTKRSKISVSTDGELSRLETPLEYKLHNAALRILK